MIKPGDRFILVPPISKRKEIFATVNVLGPNVELKAVTGNYRNDLERTVSALEGDILRHRCLTDEELRLLRGLAANPKGRTIAGNKDRSGLDALVRELLVTATAVSMDTVLYEITKPDRDVLAEQTEVQRRL